MFPHDYTEAKHPRKRILTLEMLCPSQSITSGLRDVHLPLSSDPDFDHMVKVFSSFSTVSVTTFPLAISMQSVGRLQISWSLSKFPPELSTY